MANNSNWVGGDFVYSPQWASGKSNSGDSRKKYGNAGTKRGRFNPNPVPRNHPSCMITQKSIAEKKRWADLVASGNRPCKYYSSGIRKD